MLACRLGVCGPIGVVIIQAIAQHQHQQQQQQQQQQMLPKAPMALPDAPADAEKLEFIAYAENRQMLV